MVDVYKYLESIFTVLDCYELADDPNVRPEPDLDAIRLTDLVENAIRCADTVGRTATIKRLYVRINEVLTAFSMTCPALDYVDSPKDEVYKLRLLRGEVEEFAYRIGELCEDFQIKTESPVGKPIKPSGGELALLHYYIYGKILTNAAEAEKIIKDFDSTQRPESVIRASRRFRTRTDIVGCGEPTGRKAFTLNRVINFLKEKGYPTDKAETDKAEYEENTRKNK